MKKLVKTLGLATLTGVAAFGIAYGIIGKQQNHIETNAASALINFAQKQTAFVTNTGIKDGAVSFGSDGMTFKNWAAASGNTAAVYMTDKVESDETVELKVNFAKTTSSAFHIAINFWDKVPNASFNPWNCSSFNGTGNTIDFNIENSGWFNVKHLCFNSYKWYNSTIVTGNGAGTIKDLNDASFPVRNGTLSGSQNIWDGADHTITIKKTDTAYGISLSIAYDGVAYLNNYLIQSWYKVFQSAGGNVQINPANLKGSYYLSTGFISGGATVDADVLKIKSLTRSNRTLDSELTNLALDANEYATNTNIVSGAVTTDANGTHITNYADVANKTAGLYIKEQVASGEVVTTKIKTARSGTNRLYFSMNFFATIPHESFLTYKNSASSLDSKGFLINFDFRSNWIQTDLRALKQYYTYDHVALTDGNTNIGSSGTLGGGYNIHDGNEHTVAISKKDITNGIAISLSVDGAYLYKDLEITGNKSLTGGSGVTCTPANLQGSYYFSVAMIGDAATTAADVTDISSITKSNRSAIAYNAKAFAVELLDATDAICAGYDGTTDNAAALATVWSNLAGADHFGKLAAAQQTAFKDASADAAGDYLAKGAARYDYLVAKYSLTNFANRTVTPSNGAMSVVTNNNIAVIIVAISLVSFMGVAILLKKKAR